jgi:nickel/cobalt exporter
LLGLSAAISHSLLIWVLAAAALHYGDQLNAESVEPYLQLGSAVMILALAMWMFFRTRRELHDAHHHHDHDHGGSFVLDLGHGKLELKVFEEGVPPVFQLRAPGGERLPAAKDVTLETVRPDGTRQVFQFTAKKDFLESTVGIPEPHEFDATVTIEHGHHTHTCRVEFREDDHYQHYHGEDDGSKEFQDAHELAHAQDIARRFAGRTVTTPQIILFGVTGGLMPCPAAFTVLLVCLQLKKVTLGFAMVGAFSFGLALTMVGTGALAAWSVRHAEKRFKGFGEAMRRAPYVSCVLLVLLATYMAWHGWHGLNH